MHKQHKQDIFDHAGNYAADFPQLAWRHSQTSCRLILIQLAAQEEIASPDIGLMYVTV